MTLILLLLRAVDLAIAVFLFSRAAWEVRSLLRSPDSAARNQNDVMWSTPVNRLAVCLVLIALALAGPGRVYSFMIFALGVVAMVISRVLRHREKRDRLPAPDEG